MLFKAFKISLILVWLHTPVFAQITFDNDGADNLWSNPLNWSTNNVPEVGDDVEISGYSVILDDARFCNSLTIPVSSTAHTEFDIQGTGSLAITGNLLMSVDNENFRGDIDVQGVLSVGGDFTITRGATNLQNDRLQLEVYDSGDLNITGSLVYNYESSNGENSYDIYFYGDATVDIGDDFEINHSGGTSNFSLRHEGNAALTVVDSFIVNDSGGEDVNIYFYDASTVNIQSDFAVNKVGGDDMYFYLNGTASLTIANNLRTDILGDGTTTGSGTNDVLGFDINGGTITVGDTIYMTTNASSTDPAHTRVEIDGATCNTSSLKFEQNGGTTGDMYIYLNRNNTTTATTFNCSGDFNYEHNDGDDMEFECNDNATVTVGGQSSFNLNNSLDDDIIYVDFNGGLITFSQKLDMAMAASVSEASDIYFTMNDATVNLNGGYECVLNGGDNLNFQVVSSVLNVVGDFDLNLDGGDQMLLYFYTGSTIQMSNDFNCMTTSADGDGYNMYFRDGSTLDIVNDFTYQVGGGGTDEAMNIFIDGASTMTVDDMLFDLNSGGTTAIYLNNDAGHGTGANLVVQDSVVIDHEPDARHFLLYNSVNSGDSKIDIANFYAQWDAANGDILRIRNRGTDDTLIIQNSIVVNMDAGTTNVDDNFELDFDNGYISVGGDIIGTATAGNNFELYCDDATLDIAGDVSFDNQGGDNIHIFIDGSTVNIGDSLKLTGTSQGDIILDIDDGAVVNIAKSFIGNLTQGDELRIALGDAGVDKGTLIIGEDLQTNNTLSGNDCNVSLNEGAKMTIAGNWTSNWVAGADSRIYLVSNHADDTLLVGSDINWAMSGGTKSTGDDFLFDWNEGYFEIGNDFLMSSTAGSDVEAYVDGGRFNVVRDFIINWNNSQNVNHRWNSDDNVTIGRDFIMNIDNSNNIHLDVNSGTHSVGGEFTYTSSTAANNLDVDINLGSLTIGEDYNLNCGVCNYSRIHVDSTGEFNVTDSLIVNIDSSRENFEIYIGIYTVGGAKVDVGSSIYIDQESEGDDVLITLDNDAILTVSNNIEGYVDASNGDIFRVQTNDANDTINIGNDLLMTMNSGSAHADDDVILDINNGFVNVVRHLDLQVLGNSSSTRYEQAEGNVDIGGYFKMVNDGSRNMTFDMNAGTLDVTNDITFIHTNSTGNYDFSWDQDGGTVTANEDIYIQIDGNQASYFGIDNNSVVEIADSLILDLDQSTGNLDFRINNEGGGSTGAIVNVGSSFYIDHEGAFDDVYITLAGDALLNIQDNFQIDHDMTDGDVCEVSLDSSTDTLLIGNDLTIAGIASNDADDNDMFFDLNGGYVSIGNDFVLYNDNGNASRILQSGGVFDITRYINWESANTAGGMEIEVHDGTLNVGDDVNMIFDADSTHDFIFDFHSADVNFNQDLFIQATSGDDVSFDLDLGSTFDVADSVYFDLDAYGFNEDNSGGMEIDSSRITIGSHLYVDIENNGGDFITQTYNGGYLNIGDDMTVFMSSDDSDTRGDLVRIRMYNDSDTVIIGNDLKVTYERGTGAGEDEIRISPNYGRFSVGNDVILIGSDNTSGVTYSQIDADSDIGGELIMTNTDSKEINLNVDGGTLDVQGDVTLTHNTPTSNGNCYVDIDGGQVAFHEDVILISNGSEYTAIYVDGTGNLSIADSLIFDTDVSNQNTRLLIGTQTAGVAEVTVGSSVFFDHEAAGEDASVQLNNNSKLTVANNIHAEMSSADGDYFEIEMAGDADTILVGNDVIINTVGSANTDADQFIDVDGGLLSVGNDIIMNIQNGGDAILQFADGHIDITRYLDIDVNNSARVGWNIVGGTLDVGDDVTIDHVDSDASNFEWNISGGDLNFNTDVLLTINGVNEANIYTNGANTSIDIADSLYINSIKTANISRLYIGNGTGGTAWNIGNEFYFNHEVDAGDFLTRINNGSKLTVGNNIHFYSDASGGDYAEIEVLSDDDTLIVGNDLIIRMMTGSLDGDDDVRLDIAGGRTEIGRDLILENNGGGTATFNQRSSSATTDTDIGRYLVLESNNARNITVDIDGGTVDVVDDILISHSNGSANLTWDQDGGTVTTGEDFIYTLNNNTGTYFNLDNGGVINVTDSLLFDLNETSAITRFNLNDGTDVAGTALIIGNDLVIDHEVDAEDVYIYLEGDANVEVADNIHVYHDASGGDYVEIQLTNSTDTLIVGNDIVMNMTSGLSSNDDNDIRLDLNGYTLIGNDLLYTSTAGADMVLEVKGGEHMITRYLTMNGTNADDIYANIDAGTLTVGEDVTLIINSSDDIVFDFDGGEFIASQDMLVQMNSNSDDLNWALDNAASIQVADSLFIDLNSSDYSTILMNDGGTTGAEIIVGNDLLIDVEAACNDFLLRLDGDSKVDVADDFYVLFDSDNGDYFSLHLEESNGTDTVLVGGEMVMTMTTGTLGSDNDYLRIDQNGGLIQITEDLTATLTDGDNIEILQAGGELEVLQDVNLTVTNADVAQINQDGSSGTLDLRGDVTIVAVNSTQGSYRTNGTSSTIAGDLTIDSDNGTGHATLSLNAGTNTFVGPVNLDVNNGSGGDAFLNIDGGTNLFQSNVYLTTAVGASDDIEFEVSGGTTTFEDSIVMSATNSADDVVFDFNGGTATITEDIVVTMNDIDDFEFDADGGTITILEDFIINTEDNDRSRFFYDGASTSFTVTDSLIVDLDVTSNDWLHYMGNGSTGASVTYGTFYLDHATTAQDVEFYHNRGSLMTIDNDMYIELRSDNNDYFEFDLRTTGDSVIIGGKMSIIKDAGSSNSDDVVFDLNNGYLEADDLIIDFSPAANGDIDLNFSLDGDAHLNITDTLFLDANNGDDLWVALNANDGDDAVLQAGDFIIDKEASLDDMSIRLLGANSKIKTSNNFDVTQDATSGDYCIFRLDNENDSIVVGNDFNIFYNNSNTTNGNSDLRITDNGVIEVSNDMTVNFVSGNDCEISLSDNGTISVGNNFVVDQDGGDIFYIDMVNAGAGDPLFKVDNNLVLDYAAGTSFELEANNGSTIDVGGDVEFNVNANGLQLIDLNDNAEFYIEGSFVRGASPSNFGELDAQDNATVIYDGTSTSQIFSEDAGGGSDFFRYQNVRVNNTSGLLPAVIMESVDGGGATIYGEIDFTEGQVDLNAERIYVNNTATSAVTRTSGSVLSERTDLQSTFEWQVDAVTGTRSVPFSTSTGDYIPFGFNQTSGNVGKLDVATYETSSSGTPNNLPYPATVTNMNAENVDNSLSVVDRFWQIDISGAGVSEVTFSYTDAELGGNNTITESDLGAQRWNGKDWDAPIVGTVDVAGNQVTISGVSEFSPWVLSENATPLPIELLSFEAEVEQEDVLVTWTTVSEENNDYFVVERSVDGVSFNQVGIVDGAGTSSNTLSYQFKDENPLPGTTYYRLKQVDFDGQFSYSKVEAVSFASVKESVFDIEVYPNPVSEGNIKVVVLSAFNEEEAFNYELYDINGKLLQTLSTSSGKIEIKTSELGAGVYILKATNSGQVISKRIIVQK